MSQDQLADKYGVSKGFVNKNCKGVERDAKELVTLGARYHHELAKFDDRFVTEIQKAVIMQACKLNYLTDMAMINAEESMKMKCDEQVDFKHRADTLLKTKEMIVGKSPETAIQVNNGPSISSVSEFKEIAQALIIDV